MNEMTGASRKARSFHPTNVRIEVKGVNVSDVRVFPLSDLGGVAEVRCLYPTGVAYAGGFGPDKLREAKDPVLREERVPVALDVFAEREWVRKYQGEAVRRFGDRTHSFKRGNLKADVVLTDFEPRLPGEIFAAAAEAEVA